jgi:hypothetical protein
MGIPDYVTLHPDIAKSYDVPCIEYQTHFFGSFGRLVIDQEGRLVEHQHRYESLHRTESPLMRRAWTWSRDLPKGC